MHYFSDRYAPFPVLVVPPMRLLTPFQVYILVQQPTVPVTTGSYVPLVHLSILGTVVCWEAANQASPPHSSDPCGKGLGFQGSRTPWRHRLGTVGNF